MLRPNGFLHVIGEQHRHFKLVELGQFALFLENLTVE
jgi:hypothetical protein